MFSEELNDYISEIHKESDGKKVYVGDWHTHPNGNPNYSPIDLNTIKNVANNTNIKTTNPLLIINGFTLTTNTINFYVYHKEKLYLYEKI